MPPSQVGVRVWLSRLAPYLIAALALAWVFHTTNLAALKAALANAPIGKFVVFSAFILVCNCAADVFAMQRVFHWFGADVRYRDLFIIRASTYLLAVVNYHVGQAAIVGYLYRARKVPLLKATGWILFIIGINVGTLFLLASVGASKASGALSILRWLPVVTIAGAIAWAIMLTVRPQLLVSRRILAPLFEMGVVGHIRGVLVRLPHIGVLCVFHFVSLRLFSIQLPVLDALVYLPIYFAAGSVPLISMQGLGAAQLVALQFFAPFAINAVTGLPVDATTARAAVIAYSLSTSVVSILLQVGLGLICIRSATKLGMPTEAPEQIEAAAAHAVVEEEHHHTPSAET